MYLLWCMYLPSSSGFHSNAFVPSNLFWRTILLNPALRCLVRCLEFFLVVFLFFFWLLLILLLFFFFFLFFFLFQFYIHLIFKDIWISSFLFGLRLSTFINFYIDAFHYPFKFQVVTSVCSIVTWVSNKYAFIHPRVKFSTFVVFLFYVAFASKKY